MPDETPKAEAPKPTFRLIPTLIVFGSAVLCGIAAGVVKIALF